MPLRNRSLAMGDKQVTGLADGVDPADAVNKSQLDAVASDAGDALDTHETTYHSNIADQRIITNISGASAQPSANTLTAILDDILGATQGAIITRTDTEWVKLDPGTEDQFLQVQAGPALAWADVPPPDWTVVRKTSDQAITSSTTLVDDNALSFAVDANTTYAIRVVLFVVSQLGGMKVGITGPASPASINATRLAPLLITGNYYMLGLLSGVAAYATPIIDPGLTNVTWPLRFDVLLKNGANAGTFKVQVAQGTSDASATTFQAGSYLEYTEI